MGEKKNPSTLIFWNDLANDDKLKTCSRAARGMWTTELLPKAAASAEPGVIQIGFHPCVWNDDLPRLLANAGGGTPDEVLAMLTELVNSGAASVDDNGRLYNRRMVREAGIKKARSEAGRRGAEATNSRHSTDRQNVGKHPGKPVGKPVGKDAGKRSGKNEEREQAVSHGKQTQIPDDDQEIVRQNSGKPSGKHAGDHPGKSSPSSILHASDSISRTTTESEAEEPGDAPNGDRAAAALVDEAFALWMPVAFELHIPEVGFLNRDRREVMAERLAECGGIEGWKVALEKIRNAKFLIDDTKGRPKHWVNLRNLLKPENFTGLLEGRYAEPHARTNSHASGKVSAARRSLLGAAVFAGVGPQDAPRHRGPSGSEEMGAAERDDASGGHREGSQGD